MHNITGRTRIWAILADPIEHVTTPQGLNDIMQRRGVDGVMIPLHVTASALPEAIAGLKCMQNLQGIIATVPHKVAMVDLCDDVGDYAAAVGAVNATRFDADRRLLGDILDGAGVVRGLLKADIDPAGKSVFMAGAGGAANAIAFALGGVGVSRLTIANRTRHRSLDLKQRLSSFAPLLELDIETTTPTGTSLR